MALKDFSRTKIFTGLFLIAFGVLSRFALAKYVGIPNFEAITAITLAAAVFLGGVWSFVVPLSIIAIKDAIMGNNSVLFFTWSAFAVIGMFGWMFRKHESRMRKFTPALLLQRREHYLFPLCKGGLRGILGMTGLGIVSSVFFFLYTNFGWWLVSNMYPHTSGGLIQCYAMGLPFFKNNLIGNLIFVPLFSAAAVLIKLSVKNKIWRLKNILATETTEKS